MSDIKDIDGKKELFNDALIVLEISQIHAPLVWMAVDKKNYIEAVARTFQRRGDTPESDNFEAWADYNGEDLKEQYIMSFEEAMLHIVEHNEYSWLLIESLEKWGFIKVTNEQ